MCETFDSCDLKLYSCKAALPNTRFQGFFLSFFFAPPSIHSFTRPLCISRVDPVQPLSIQVGSRSILVYPSLSSLLTYSRSLLDPISKLTLTHD